MAARLAMEFVLTGVSGLGVFEDLVGVLLVVEICVEAPSRREFRR